jgi:HEPN domain-containing protein
MKLPDEALALLVRQWVAKAEVNYRTAERLVRDDEPIRESIAFHCQQAAEKYLKAFLVWQHVEFPKTHSIGRLLDLVASVAPELAASLADAISLTPFGVEIRYPGDLPELLPGEEQTVFNLAKRTREAILAQIDPYLSGG